MKNIAISLVFFIMLQSHLWAQGYKFIPGKGIESIDLLINQSTLDDVVEIFGEPEEVSIGEYIYQSIGLTFRIERYDKNRIVRSIYIEAPFQGQTEQGIILGKSTMQDVFDLYKENGCYSSGGESRNPQDGISFYVESKKMGYGCNMNGKIHRIGLHMGNEDKGNSNNYVFDNEQIDTEVSRITEILRAKPFDKSEFDTYFQRELQNDEKLFGVNRRSIINRTLDYDIIQEKIEIRLGYRKLRVILLSRNSKVLYVKFFSSAYKEDKIFVEHTDTTEINKIQELRQNEGLREIDWTVTYDFPIEIYTYGIFCGVGGSPPSKCLKMLDLVNTDDYDVLLNWSTSLNPEIVAYGLTGLSFLQQKGYPIPISEDELFSIIAQKTTSINTCQGCYYGSEGAMKELLSRKKLSAYFKALRQTGWIRR